MSVKSYAISAAVLALWMLGCDDPGLLLEPDCTRPLLFEKSPGAALQGTGWHRVYVQGGSATPSADGQFGMSEQRNDVAPGDHFLLSEGAFVEWIYPVTDRLTGHVFVHMARVDDPDVVARYELLLVNGGMTVGMLTVDDQASGTMGYSPYETCIYQAGADRQPQADTHLLLRATNLSGGMLGIVTQPPDYYTWIDVEVH